MGAALLFILLVMWQMPHFFSIALYRFDDYKEANIPVLPVSRGLIATTRQMLYYIAAFILSELLLFGYAGVWYLAVSIPLSIAWLVLCLKGFKNRDTVTWAKSMFRLSLVIITLVSLMLSVDTL